MSHLVPAWHILTGEYPPQTGGVSDYTQLVANGLAKAGAEIHVWAPSLKNADPQEVEGRKFVHREAGHWSKADLKRLGARLDAFPSPRRLLVQYTPFAWGYRGLNLGFCHWLERRRRSGDEIVAMIHEAVYTWTLGDKPMRLILDRIHRLMLPSLLRSCQRFYYASPSNMPFFERYGRADCPMTWLPVPSTVPVIEDAAGIAALRQTIAPAHKKLLGHFGTFGEEFKRELLQVLPPLLLDHADRAILLIGRSGPTFATEFKQLYPGLADRVLATGGLSPEQVSRHLQACDVSVQPYMDGVSTRRTTVMASLAHGRPIATNRGPNTEDLWAETECVELAHSAGAPVAAAAERLLADAQARQQRGALARDTYQKRFAIERTIETIIKDS